MSKYSVKFRCFHLLIQIILHVFIRPIGETIYTMSATSVNGDGTRDYEITLTIMTNNSITISQTMYVIKEQPHFTIYFKLFRVIMVSPEYPYIIVMFLCPSIQFLQPLYIPIRLIITIFVVVSVKTYTNVSKNDDVCILKTTTLVYTVKKSFVLLFISKATMYVTTE